MKEQFLLTVVTFFTNNLLGRVLLSLSILGVCGSLIYAIAFKTVEVKTELGTFSIKSGNTQNAIFLLNPAGEKGSPWVATGIKVRKGDKLKISATGKIHLALK
jgi:hypothetical protein